MISLSGAVVPNARLNAQRQITLPAEVCERLHLRAGDEVQLRLVDDHTLLVDTRPRTTRGPGDPMAIAGKYKVDRSISLEDMERAIEEGATGR